MLVQKVPIRLKPLFFECYVMVSPLGLPVNDLSTVLVVAPRALRCILADQAFPKTSGC